MFQWVESSSCIYASYICKISRFRVCMKGSALIEFLFSAFDRTNNDYYKPCATLQKDNRSSLLCLNHSSPDIPGIFFPVVYSIKRNVTAMKAINFFLPHTLSKPLERKSSDTCRVTPPETRPALDRSRTQNLVVYQHCMCMLRALATDVHGWAGGGFELTNGWGVG